MREIETDRLMLRPWEEKDAESLYAYAKSTDVGPHAGWKPHADVAESLHIIKTMFMPNNVWAITIKTGGKIIGSVGLEPDKRRPGVNSRELGYSLAKEYWGNGVMTEAAKAVIDFAFETYKLDIISVCTGPLNKRSQGVIQKCGFVYEGTERLAYKTYNGTIRDTKIYSILREEWEQARQ
jgi:RimJ/RimL family protein N-acetyltransferase